MDKQFRLPQMTVNQAVAEAEWREDLEKDVDERYPLDELNRLMKREGYRLQASPGLDPLDIAVFVGAWLSIPLGVVSCMPTPLWLGTMLGLAILSYYTWMICHTFRYKRHQALQWSLRTFLVFTPVSYYYGASVLGPGLFFNPLLWHF